MKKVLIIIGIIVVMVGIFLVVFNSLRHNREEANIEYANLMKKHMEEKYSKVFEIVDMDFPKSRI